MCCEFRICSRTVTGRPRFAGQHPLPVTVWLRPLVPRLSDLSGRYLAAVRGLANLLLLTNDNKSNGAACVTRTRDPRITNAVLYRLS